MPKNLTISIPDELAKKMEEFSEVNWSEVARKAFQKYIEHRTSEKGELLKGLEEFLRTKKAEREPIRKAEIERFTKKWGKPDKIYPDDSPGARPPYVSLQKAYRVKYDDTEATIKILNGVLWSKYSSMSYNPEDWKRVNPIVDYFKSRGFKIVVIPFLQDAIAFFVTGGDKRKASDLQHLGREYYGLFAYDDEDEILIDYKEVKRR